MTKNTVGRERVSPTLNLEINKDNYQRAVSASSGSCLVADAIKDQYPQFTHVKVDVATVRFTDKAHGERYIYLTPSSVAETLLAFDQGWPEDEKTLPKKFQIRTALKVVPITASASTNKRSAERRVLRMKELEAREQSGELTRDEKRSLTQYRTPKESVQRPPSYGSSQASEDKGDVVVRGGSPPPTGRLNANLLHGRDRHFGAKRAQPSEVFKKAVDEAVKADRAKRRKKG